MTHFNPYNVKPNVWAYRSRSRKSVEIYIRQPGGLTYDRTVSIRLTIGQLKRMIKAAGEIRERGK